MPGMMRPSVVSDIGKRIRHLRCHLDLTLEALAERSGVSRRMLTQVELGQANPSVATLDKVAAGLDTTFAAMIGVPSRAPATGVEVWSTEGGSWAYLLNALDLPDVSIELWKWRLEGQDSYEAAGGVDEPEFGASLIHVLDGELVMSHRGTEVIVGVGETLRSAVGPCYSYRSAAPNPVTFTRVVALPRPPTARHPQARDPGQGTR